MYKAGGQSVAELCNTGFFFLTLSILKTSSVIHNIGLNSTTQSSFENLKILCDVLNI